MLSYADINQILLSALCCLCHYWRNAFFKGRKFIKKPVSYPFKDHMVI